MSLRVLVCGGGNAAHVFLGELAARGHRPTLLSTFPGEAARLRAGCEANDGQVEVRGWSLDPSGENIGVMHGRPTSIVGSFAEAFAPRDTWSSSVERYDLILLSLPAFAHESYLQGVVPYIKRYSDDPDRLPVVLAAAVAQGGFDMAVRAALGGAGAVRTRFIIAGLETLPWACRVIQPGRLAEVLGTKAEVDAAVATHPDPSAARDVTARTLHMLQRVVGNTPKLRPASGFLGIALMNINSYWHPTLLWHRWKDWDGKETFDAPPLLYETAPDDLACDAMSAEVGEVVAALRRRYGSRLVDTLDSATPVRDWFLRSYGREPSLDTSSTAAMMRTNPAYKGLTHPMKVRPNVEGPKNLVPDFSHRYITEDVPYGLVVTRGVAELAGVPTPTIDRVVAWAQRVAGLSYLVEREIDKPGGELSHPGAEEPTATEGGGPPRMILGGEDIARSRCPQRYGWFDIDWLMTSNGYCSSEPSGESGGEEERWLRGKEDVAGEKKVERKSSGAA